MDGTRVIDGLEIRSPLRFSQSVVLSTPVETIFDLVSSHVHLCDLIPNLHSVHVEMGMSEGAAGVGMVRWCDFGNDMWIEEKIVLWDPPNAFAYQIVAPNPFGLTDHLALIHCCPTDSGSRLTWQQHYHHADLTSMDALMVSMMDGLMMNLSQRYNDSG